MSDERKHCEAVAREADFHHGCSVDRVADLISHIRPALQAHLLRILYPIMAVPDATGDRNVHSPLHALHRLAG